MLLDALVDGCALATLCFVVTQGETEWSSTHNWLDPDAHACGLWFGASCNVNNQPTRLELCLNELGGGTLPTTIGLLTHLTSLELWTNNTQGTIPTEVGRLDKLVNLHLGE